jgi:transposase-like protein
MGLVGGKRWLGIGVSVHNSGGRPPLSYLRGSPGLREVARRNSLSRNLVRLWIRKYEDDESNDEPAEASHTASMNVRSRNSNAKLGSSL